MVSIVLTHILASADNYVMVERSADPGRALSPVRGWPTVRWPRIALAEVAVFAFTGSLFLQQVAWAGPHGDDRVVKETGNEQGPLGLRLRTGTPLTSAAVYWPKQAIG